MLLKPLALPELLRFCGIAGKRQGEGLVHPGEQTVSGTARRAPEPSAAARSTPAARAVSGRYRLFDAPQALSARVGHAGPSRGGPGRVY